MIDETIARIEERLRGEPLSPAKRREIETLLAQLRREAATLPREVEGPLSVTDGEKAEVRSALEQLKRSLTEFETTHPQLVGIVNRISTFLSNMGI